MAACCLATSASCDLSTGLQAAHRVAGRSKPLSALANQAVQSELHLKAHRIQGLPAAAHESRGESEDGTALDELRLPAG